MKVKYIGVRRREIATPRGITVEPGDVFEVGEKLGASLLLQTSKFVPAEQERQERDEPAPARRRARSESEEKSE